MVQLQLQEQLHWQHWQEQQQQHLVNQRTARKIQPRTSTDLVGAVVFYAEACSAVHLREKERTECRKQGRDLRWLNCRLQPAVTR